MKSRIRELLSAPMAVAMLALFVAVGGGSAMALSGKNSVNSGDIKPDAVKSSDINDGAVGLEDLDTDAASPRGVATVNAAGVVQPNFPPLNVAQTNISKPNGTNGLYCFAGLPFAVRAALANDSFDQADEFVSVTPGQVGACPVGTQVTVRTRNNGGTAADSGFSIVFF